MATSAPLAAAGFRLAEWVFLTLLLALFTLIPALLLGVWAARRRLLDDPEQHRSFLARTAVGGLALAVAGGLPMALQAAGFAPAPTLVTGMVTGRCTRSWDSPAVSGTPPSRA